MTEGNAPYARIVAELRGRIAAGELRPGDRVPSTREITREWRVAMATATKALSTLRLEGLVRAVPGVGTVVAPGSPPARQVAAPRGSRSSTEHVLGPEAIVAAAIALADAEGVGAVSMRRVASDMGVAVMSLYRHVADKDDLLIRMMDAALREQPLPAVPPDGWRPGLEVAARTLWAAFRRHPWLAGQMALTRPQPTPGALAYAEWMLAALDGLGLPEPVRVTSYILVFSFIRGQAINLEFEVNAEADTGLTSDEWMNANSGRLQSSLRGGQFPQMERITGEDFDLDLDAMFETGLGYLLDGLERRIPSAPPL